jgi:hypothetical protein
MADPKDPRPIRIVDTHELEPWQRERVRQASSRLRADEHAADCLYRKAQSGSCTFPNHPAWACVPVRRYSASQIQLFSKCKRKWWYEYVGGFKTPPSKSQAYGKLIHAEIETFIKTGVPGNDPRAHTAIIVLDDYLREHGRSFDSIEVEGEITLDLEPAYDAMPRCVVGYLDVSGPDEHAPLVLDHKTTSNPDKWARTEYELVEDAQLLIYARHALDAHEHATGVHIAHNVIPTKGANRPRLVSASVERAHVDARWSSYLKLFDEMDKAREAKAIAIEPTGIPRGECHRYEGCPHQARCVTAIFTKGRTMSQQASAELKARLEAIRGRTSGTQAPAPVQTQAPVQQAAPTQAPAPVQQHPPAQGDVNSTLAALKNRVRGVAVDPQAQTQAPVQQAAPAPNGARAPAPSAPVSTRAPSPQAPAPQAPSPEPVQDASGFEGVVYPNRLDILILNGAVTHGLESYRLEQWIAPLLELVHHETGLSWQAHEYKIGIAHLIDLINRYEVPSVLCVDTTTYLGKCVLEALVPRANAIIEGRGM